MDSTLHIFDFDDTLIDSEAEIRISHKDGSNSVLSSDEYAKYTTKPGDIFDFTDFDSYPKKLQIIEPVFSELRAAVQSSGIDNVVILTARSNPVPVQIFLKENKIPNIEVIAVGTSSPQAKALYILDRVKNENFSEVVVFEDNVRNIRRIRKVLTDTGIKLQTNRVKNGAIVDTINERRYTGRNK